MNTTPDWLKEILKKHRRIVIAGGPRTGKTTLARTVHDRPVLSTDAYMNVQWAQAPEMINDAVSELPAYLLEGIQVGRCLRKGLKPDCVIWLETPVVARTKPQETMAKGCTKIFQEWLSKMPHGIHCEFRP